MWKGEKSKIKNARFLALSCQYIFWVTCFNHHNRINVVHSQEMKFQKPFKWYSVVLFVQKRIQNQKFYRYFLFISKLASKIFIVLVNYPWNLITLERKCVPWPKYIRIHTYNNNYKITANNAWRPLTLIPLDWFLSSFFVLFHYFHYWLQSRKVIKTLTFMQ